MKLLGKKVFCLFIILSVSAAYFCLRSDADTVYLKDKSSLKGIVVEDYVDRIIYSTIDGEKEVLKSDILRIEYDESLDNLINLGDSAFEKGYYKAALKYYLLAQKMDPNIKTLNNKVYYTESIIYKTPEIQKKEYLALKNDIIAGRITPTPSAKLTPQQALKKDLGISIASSKEHGKFYIKNLTWESPFRKAGALRGDSIIAVWSKLCNYLTLEDLYDLLTNPNETMTAVVIERNLKLQKGGLFDAKLSMEWEGAVVNTVPPDGLAKKAGLRSGDLIVAVGGKSIRYTPLKAVLKWLQKRKPETEITIRRKLTIFREG